MQTHYQHLEQKIQAEEKARKSLNTKILRLKKKNDGIYPPGIAELSKKAHTKLINVIQLQDQLVKLQP